MAEGFRRVTLTGELLDLAVERARSLPIFDYSHRKFQANVVGCIGEIVFEKFLDHHGVRYRDDTTSTQHDYIIGQSLTLDVKTKDRTVQPRRNYENSVPLYNHDHQRPDYYYFVSLLRDPAISEDDVRRFQVAFLLGGIDLPKLEQVGKHWEAGQIDPANGTQFWTACMNVQMSELRSNTEMLSLFKSPRQL